MPTVDAVVDCPVYNSFRVQQVAGMFDLPLADKLRVELSAEVPDADEDWKIGAIVGPSGSGKSTIARHAYGDCFYTPGEWREDAAAIDCFGEQSIKDITATLTAVGFSSPPAWCKPFSVLSNGEKFRCDLARALLLNRPLTVFDEFTSVVDRTVAKIGSAALSKTVRRGKEKFVAVSCHYDILDWLEPDWVLDMATGQLARGRLRRPPITIEVVQCNPSAWSMFAKHHYLNPDPIRGATCYLATIDALPVAFCAIRHQWGMKRICGRFRISRIVVLPDYQGVGVARAVIDFLAEHTLRTNTKCREVNISTGHPGMIAALRRAKNWRLRKVLKTGGARNLHATLRTASSCGRAICSFVFLPAKETAPASRAQTDAASGEAPTEPTRSLPGRRSSTRRVRRKARKAGSR